MLRPSPTGVHFLSFLVVLASVFVTIVIIVRGTAISSTWYPILDDVSDLPASWGVLHNDVVVVVPHTATTTHPAQDGDPSVSIPRQDNSIAIASQQHPSSDTTMDNSRSIRLPVVPTTTLLPNPTTTHSERNNHRTHTAEYNNSQAWLNGERLSNIDEDTDFVWSQILDADKILLRDHPPNLLFERTICHADSPFKNMYPHSYAYYHHDTPSSSRRHHHHHWDVTNITLVQEWTFRLIYLGIHSWHHHPAKPEAHYRRNNDQYHHHNHTTGSDDDHDATRNKNPTSFHHDTETNHLPNKLLHNYDFECPTSKYIITSVPSAGLGASIRTSAVDSLFLGMALGRITLFLANVQPRQTNNNNNNNTINNSNNSSIPSIPDDLSKPFLLGGCERHDLQCAFLPTTPCTITKEALERQMIRTIPENIERVMYTKGKIRDADMVRAKYIYLPLQVRPLKYDRGLGSMVRYRLYKHVRTIIEQYRDEGPVEKFQVMEEAMRRIRDNDFNFPTNNTTGIEYNPFRQAAVLYMFRLNRRMERDVDAGVHATLPPNFDPSQSLGFPIRGSDKCLRESSCLPFETYMDLATEMVATYYHNRSSTQGGGGGNVTVLVTTEDSAIARASKQYQSHDFKVVMNTDDVHQNTGRPSLKRYFTQSRQIMKTTLIAIKLQLHARRTVGNCCSNFHLVLFDLLNSNCGLSESRQCLQEHSNPKYQICCLWDKTCVQNTTKGSNGKR